MEKFGNSHSLFLLTISLISITNNTQIYICITREEDKCCISSVSQDAVKDEREMT